jgi:5-methylcytosine-specific restriction endonuclease McrA
MKKQPPFKMRNLVRVTPATLLKKKRKDTISKALREQVWIKHAGRVFECKCPTEWCQNMISVFDFESGHDIPESKGGQTSVENLFPICSRCNKGMGNRYTFHEWQTLYSNKKSSQHPSPEELASTVSKSLKTEKQRRSFVERFLGCLLPPKK